MIKQIALATAVALALQASAQTVAPAAPPAPSVTLSWQPVTTMSDGSPATGPVSYNLYGGHSMTGPWSAAINITTVGTVRTGVQLGLDCYYITAVINSIESLPVLPACVTVTAAVSTVPSTPGGFVAQQP